MNLNAEQIRLACDGEFLVPPLDTTVFATTLKIDSRKIECGDLFVAINGDKTDGHKFVNDALNDKASIIIVEQDIQDDTRIIANDHAASIIKVKDSKKAVHDIAVEWRKNLLGKIIGVTGSAGKTSTKNFIYQVLSSRYRVTANDGNYNNDLGLPITLCKSNLEDDYVVTEMGMNAAGEIANLCEIAQPMWGVITNVGTAHIEFLKSRENIAKAKSELALAIPNNIGKMFLWADDEYRNFILDYAKLKDRNIETILFGGTKLDKNFVGPQVWYENLNIDEDGNSTFDVYLKGFINSDSDHFSCSLKVPGKFNVVNACCAFAVGMMADIMPSKAIESLSKSRAEAGRLEKLKAKEGFLIINDAYNANPQSMIASLETFSSIKCEGKRIAFLGDMFELGKFSDEAHKLVGASVAQNKIDTLICVGKMSMATAESAKSNGLNDVCVFWFDNLEDAKSKLLEIVNSQDLVLFKASNGMHFQTIVKDLAV